MTLTGLTETTYNLDPTPIGSGGEGDVYDAFIVKAAKIYKKNTLTDELEEKLRFMIENPPNESVLSQVAWPLDLIRDENEVCQGFIMPKLSINTELAEVYKYPSTLPISSQQKINIAKNICVVISEVHKAGYVFGDFNPRNIGLDINTGLVSFLDTDTYHVFDSATGKTYRCNVCASGYAAPELLRKCADHVTENPTASKNAYALTPLPTFTTETDNFALAIHIFKLLMNGYTPFGGIIESASVSQSSPGVGDAAVRRDSYCFKPGYKPQSAAIPLLESFPEEIADLFTRAFIKGKSDPGSRPNAVDWHGALVKYEQTLGTCSKSPLHQYDRRNISCPFCEADNRYASALAGDTQSVAPTLSQTTYAPPPEIVQPAKATQPSYIKQNASTSHKTSTIWATLASASSNLQNISKTTSVGDIVKFGGRGWQVLDVRGGNVLLLSKYILKVRNYHNTRCDITWENSMLRKHLNSVFFDTFSVDERASILMSLNINTDNHWFSTSGGYSTHDRIFLLSLEEVVEYFGDSGQLSQPKSAYNLSDQFDSKRKATDVAGKASWWWLRTPGDSNCTAISISGAGSIRVDGIDVTAIGGVRPALWLSI